MTAAPSYRPMFGPDGWDNGLSAGAVSAECEARGIALSTGVSLIAADSIRPEPVSWLWEW